MAHGTKSFRQVVAEYYMKSGKKFSYLDIVNDFGIAEMLACSCFSGILRAKKYVTRLDKSSNPRKMTVMDIHDKIEYTKPIGGQKPIKKKAKDSCLQAQMIWLRR